MANKQIGMEAFYLDMQLKKMTIAAPEPPVFGDSALLFNPYVKTYWETDPAGRKYMGLPPLPTLFVPEGARDAYRQKRFIRQQFAQVKEL